MKVRWRTLAVILIAAWVVLAACGGDDKSAEEAQADLCTDLDGLQTALTGLAGLSVDSSVDDLESERDAINDALDDVRSSADDVEDAEIEALEDAYDSLESAVGDISDDMPISDALASVQDESAAVVAAWDQLFTATGCA